MKEYRVDIFGLEKMQSFYFNSADEAVQFANRFPKEDVKEIYLLRKNVINRYEVLNKITWKEV